jgi:hypothetical protein
LNIARERHSTEVADPLAWLLGHAETQLLSASIMLRTSSSTGSASGVLNIASMMDIYYQSIMPMESNQLSDIWIAAPALACGAGTVDS